MSNSTEKIEVILPQKEKRLIDDANSIINVAAYCRVSTDDKDQRNSLKAQEEYFTEYIKSHENWTNIGIFSDEGASGTDISKRKHFNEMISLAKHKKIDLILTKEVSRFSRNANDFLTIITDLRSIGVYIYFLSDGLSTENAEDINELADYAVRAQRESFRTSRRVRWGQDFRMRQGVVFGRKDMYGYKIERDSNGQQHFVIIEEEAEIIRKIYKFFLEGDGINRIVRSLKTLGVKSKYKNDWSTTVVLRILRNEKYCGALYQGKTFTEDPFTHKKKYNHGESALYKCEEHHMEQAIVSREDWDKVQKKLLDNAATPEQKAKHSNRYWLSGKIFCGSCGNRCVHYSKKQKNGNTYYAWVCLEKQKNGNQHDVQTEENGTITIGCNQLPINDKIIKIAVHDLIFEVLANNSFKIEQTVIETLKPEELKTNKITKELSELNKKADQIDEKIIKLTDLRLSEEIQERDYYNSLKNYVKERDELLKKCSKLQLHEKPPINTKQILMNFKKNLESLIKLEDDEFTEQLYGRIVNRVNIFTNYIFEIQFSFFPLPIKVQYQTQSRLKNFKAYFRILSIGETNYADPTTEWKIEENK